jgi:ParE toxin of type II toxin-antitoxin system, parDE
MKSSAASKTSTAVESRRFPQPSSGKKSERSGAPEIEFHPEAKPEAVAAIDWYAERSATAAANFEEELIRAQQEVERSPNRWARYLHGTRCYRLKRFPYALVYIERADRIIGVAVAHLHRRPGYWRHRVDSQK